MPVIPSLVLTNTNPVVTYTASVVTSGSVIADSLGNQITYLQLTCSFSETSSVQTSWEMSSSYASASTWANSSSYASRSFASTSASFSSASISSSWANVAGTMTASGLIGMITNSVSASSVTASTFGIPSGLFSVDPAGDIIGWNLTVNKIDSDSHIIQTDSQGNIFAYGITASVANAKNISVVACDNPSVILFLHVSQSGQFNWDTTPN